MASYLQGTDLAVFGVANATAAQIAEASLLIDAYLNRPEGLIYDAGPPMVMDLTQQPIQSVIQVSPRSCRQIILDRKPVVSVLSVNWSVAPGLTWKAVSNFSYVNGFGLTLPPFYANTLVQVDFIAGWTYATLPSAIKQACASIVNSFMSSDVLTGNILSFKMGDGQVTRKDTSHLNESTQSLLRPWRRVYAL